MSRPAKVVNLAERRQLASFLKRCEEAAAAFPYYVLDDARNVVRATSIDDWVAMKMDFDNRCRVGSTHVGNLKVSTVFLGIDHNHARVMRPELPTLCFETMVFGPGKAEVIDRYTSWAEAEAGHAATVDRLESER